MRIKLPNIGDAYDGRLLRQVIRDIEEAFRNTAQANAKPKEWQDLTDAATIAVNAAKSDAFKVTLGGNRTLGNPTNLYDNMVLRFLIAQDATGGRTLAFDTKYEWPGGTPPTITVTAGRKDLIECCYDADSDKLFCSVKGQNYD